MSARARFLFLAFVVLAVFVGGIVISRSGAPDVAVIPPREPALPDLVSLPLADFLIGTDAETGNQTLRFTSSIANIGDGPLRVYARRSSPSDSAWSVIQSFDEPDGDPSGLVTPANLTYGGHGHDHWHLRFGAAYRLSQVDGGDEARSQTKAGYCFFDQVQFDGAAVSGPPDRMFLPDTCGTPDSTEVTMGMSVGWQDPYFWQLEDQSVDVTGLPDGPYRLTAEADPDGWLREVDESNNGTWTDVVIGTLPDGLRSVEVIDSADGP
jgi:Lysyl oxidase